MYSRNTTNNFSKKYKSNYKTKLNRIKKIQQKGGVKPGHRPGVIVGSTLCTLVNNIQEFVDKLLTRYNDVDLPKDFKYDKPEENTYYSRLLQILPCASRMKDALGHRGRRLMKYKFNSELTKSADEVLLQDESFWGEHNTIVCSKLSIEEAGYQITMVEFQNDIYNPCDIQVLMVDMRSIKSGGTGHAIILLINQKIKEFSLIDPNGGGTTVDDDLDDNKMAIMLKQCIPGYTHVPIVFPPCQAVSTFPNSCMVWSQLFTELILRFGLKNTRGYFDSLIKYKPTNHSVIAQRITRNATYANDVVKTRESMDKIIKCFVIYIKACIDDVSGDTWIYPQEYIQARELRSKISDVARHIRELEIYKSRKRGQYIFFHFNNFWITIDANWNWILCYDNYGKKYLVKSNEFDQQYLATLLAKVPEFRMLMEHLNQTPLDKMSYFTKNATDSIVGYLFPKKGYL